MLGADHLISGDVQPDQSKHYLLTKQSIFCYLFRADFQNTIFSFGYITIVTYTSSCDHVTKIYGVSSDPEADSSIS